MNVADIIFIAHSSEKKRKKSRVSRRSTQPINQFSIESSSSRMIRLFFKVIGPSKFLSQDSVSPRVLLLSLFFSLAVHVLFRDSKVILLQCTRERSRNNDRKLVFVAYSLLTLLTNPEVAESVQRRYLLFSCLNNVSRSSFGCRSFLERKKQSIPNCDAFLTFAITQSCPSISRASRHQRAIPEVACASLAPGKPSSNYLAEEAKAEGTKNWHWPPALPCTSWPTEIWFLTSKLCVYLLDG